MTYVVFFSCFRPLQGSEGPACLCTGSHPALSGRDLSTSHETHRGWTKSKLGANYNNQEHGLASVIFRLSTLKLGLKTLGY